MKKKLSGSGTLLMSVIMSSPGPLVVGLGLLVGRSSTQIADFVRRSCELLAIIASFFVYHVTNRGETPDTTKNVRLEQLSNRFVGAMMCLSGVIMLFLALLQHRTEKGNVIPGLVIAVLGVVANTIFWIRYTKLGRQTGNSILLVQSRLYRAKSLVDFCVTIALTTVALFPSSRASYYLDIVGSVVVAAYLISCGVKTMRESWRA